MKKVAVYMRVGNKEQIDTRGQERKIPTPEELEAEGYEVVTLPKKKAWLYMRSSVGIPDTERNARMNILRAQAEHRGYEVVGETTVIGASYNSSPAIDDLLNNEFKRNGVDVLFMRGIRDMSFQIAESIEIYDKVTDKGYELRTADGSDAVEKIFRYFGGENGGIIANLEFGPGADPATVETALAAYRAAGNKINGQGA